MARIVLLAHDLRSAHNVGSLLRTADGLAVSKVYFTGYTPYPIESNDQRLPHLSKKIQKAISKTALGAESTVKWEHCSDINKLVKELQERGYKVYALEQAKGSIRLNNFKPSPKCAIIVGNEVTGLPKKVLDICDGYLEIPMLGSKESFNVAQAAAIALYHTRHLG